MYPDHLPRLKKIHARKIHAGKLLKSDQCLGLESDGNISHLKFLLNFMHPAGKALNTLLQKPTHNGVAVTMAPFILVREILKNMSKIFCCWLNGLMNPECHNFCAWVTFYCPYRKQIVKEFCTGEICDVDSLS